MTEATNTSVAPEETTANASSSRTRRRSTGLSGMVLAELQQLAQSLGITGTARMRKSQLIEAIKAAQAEQSGPDGAGSTGDRATQTATRRGGEHEQDQMQFPESGPAETSTAPVANSASNTDATRSQAPSTVEHRAAGTAEPAGNNQASGDQRVTEENQGRGDQEGPRTADKSGDGQRGRDGDQRSQRSRDTRQHQRGESQSDKRGTRDNNRENRGDQQNGQGRGQTGDRERSERDDDDGGRRRRRRGRDRFRDRRGGGRDRADGEPQIAEDDVLIPVAGILDVLENYAFVRTSGFLAGPNDVYVSLAMVKRHSLRKGDAITGMIRQPREGERREKFNPLVRVDTVNGTDPETTRGRIDFNKLTPLYPQERLRLETEPSITTTRVIDLMAPVGKGQRGLIVSPSKAGKTLVLQGIANAITTNNPECHLMVVLADERPEEVTDMQRAVKGEVIASTFDRPADDHTTVAELAIERAKRLVELGHDVVVLLDSITRLGRAYNLAAPASGRILSGGVDSSALYPPKKFFGAARNIENGGSLTILATALIETGSKMDEVIFEEFKGTGNMELRLRREYADKRIYPAIDVDASGTRREELLMGRDELSIVWKLRRVLSGLEGLQALELVLEKLKQTKSNGEFLMQINKTMPTAPSSGRDEE